MYMTKLLFGIFAHPDDEAFGPAGTFIKEVQNGTELHLITLTLGDAGANPDGVHNLADERQMEWRTGGDLMGATSMTHLGYMDGQLTNQSLVSAGEKLVEIIKSTAKDRENIEIDILCFDFNGISGHIDHIVASRAAAWAFYALRNDGHNMGRLRLWRLSAHEVPTSNINWLYMEPGYTDSEIDEIVDAREYHDKIVEVIRAHKSQRYDGESHIHNRGENLGINHYKILN